MKPGSRNAASPFLSLHVYENLASNRVTSATYLNREVAKLRTCRATLYPSRAVKYMELQFSQEAIVSGQFHGIVARSKLALWKGSAE